MNQLIDHLKEKLTRPLPGTAAQYRMAAVGRHPSGQVPHHAVQAGVLNLLYPKAGTWHVLLTERTARNPNDRHGGQISFPGGKYEAEDQTLDYTALREAHEEVGIPPESVTLLGKLSTLYIPVSNFHVHPYLGVTDHTPQFFPEPEEVKSILEVPLDLLRREDIRKTTDLVVGNGIRLSNVPYFDVFGKIVWGATAMMLSEFLALLDEPAVQEQA